MTRKQDNLITPAAYAKRIGRSRQIISRQIKTGQIPIHDGLVDPEEADRARKGNVSSRRRAASPRESSCSGARDILSLSEADLATILGDLDDTPTTDDDTVLEQFLIRYGMMRLCEHILGKKQQGAFIGCAMDAGASREQAKQHAAVFAYLTCLWVADLLNHEKWFDPELAAKFRQDVQSWGEKNILWRDEPK